MLQLPEDMCTEEPMLVHVIFIEHVLIRKLTWSNMNYKTAFYDSKWLKVTQMLM